MIKRMICATLIFVAVVLSACGSIKPEPTPASSPTPDTLAALREEIQTIADAEVSEEEGTLSVNILVDETDTGEACEVFFEQAGRIYARCLAGTEYTGICFSLLCGDIVAGGLTVLPDEGGMKVMEPVSLDEEYEDELTDAFYESAFARNIQE